MVYRILVINMYKTQATLIFVLIVNVLLASSSSLYGSTENKIGLQEKMLSQHLDHFDQEDKRNWTQRYFINDEFYNNKTMNSYLYIGGEYLVSERMAETGAVYETAKRFGGIIFVLEHRFYGKSQPFENISTSNLRYLDSLQALHDTANFIMEMNSFFEFGNDTKWITVGGSYGGSLSAWMRLKFPHLVYGAVASSAPLHAKLEYPEYLQIVSNDIALYGDECVKNVNTGFEQLENILHNTTNVNITSMFNLCTDFKTPLTKMDKLHLYENIIDNGFALAAQSHTANITMDQICDVMNNKTFGTEFERLGTVMSLINEEECFEAYWDKYVELLKIETVDEYMFMRQWWYQTCTEFGWYQITDNSNPAFGNRIPLEYFLNLCKEVYGDKYQQTYIENQVKHTNNRYGGTNIDTSRLILIHGSLDPWHQVGLYEGDNTKQYTVIFIEGAAHCADLTTASENDSIQLKNAREEVLQIIGEWLNSAPRKTISKLMLIIGIYFSISTI